MDELPSTAVGESPVLPYRRADLGERPDDCYRCGYPLLGIDDEQPCPECGLLARRSRRQTDELHNTRPRWLMRISRGGNLILIAIVIGVAWPFVWVWIARDVFRWTISPLVSNVLPLLGFDLAGIAFLVGGWFLASAERYPPADRADRRLRRALRVFATAPLLVVLTVHAAEYLNTGAWRTIAAFTGRAFAREMMDVAFWVVLMVGCTPLPLLLFARLRGLARRARSAHLAEHCTIVGIGTSASLVLFGAFTLIASNARDWGLGSYWTGRSQVALAMMVAVGVGTILFTLWSLYLFVRFVIAFHRAAWELRGKWHADDRAVAP